MSVCVCVCVGGGVMVRSSQRDGFCSDRMCLLVCACVREQCARVSVCLVVSVCVRVCVCVCVCVCACVFVRRVSESVYFKPQV